MNVISLLTPKAQVAYIYDDCTIRQGLEKLRAHGYTAVPVLARDGRYVGTVSEGDFLWNILDGNDNSLRAKEKQPLRQIVRPGFNPAVRIDITMPELLDRAIQQSFIPVVDDRGAFVGIVTRQTVIRRLAVPAADSPQEVLSIGPAGQVQWRPRFPTEAPPLPQFSERNVFFYGAASGIYYTSFRAL